MNAAGCIEAPLSDRLLRSWLRCRRRAWLDRHGPLDQRQWSAHRALALEDQLRCFQLLLPRRPGRGEEACARGDDGVMGLRLHGRFPSSRGELVLEAHPPLLQKVPGSSRWGAHAYRPVLARQGRNLTREHRLVLALWGWMLADHQGGEVPRALALGRSGQGLEREQLSLTASLRRQAEDSLERLASALQRPEPPPLVNDRKKCVLCGWRSLCDAEAAAEGHLSEVSGIGGKRRDLLLDLGVTSLEHLACSDPDQLAEALAVHGEQHREVAPQLVEQARVQAAGVERLRADAAARASAALPELQTASGVLIYDIEADPDARDDFLHGFLMLRRGMGQDWPSAAAACHAASQERLNLPDGRYHPLLALQEHGERRLWLRLRNLLERHPDWPVLHYGETESINLLRLAERQGLDQAARERLRARLIDVHQRLRRHWLLPVNSYGLKAVAGWQGFRWSQRGVDGARCLLWWRQWRVQWHPDGGWRQPLRSRQKLQRILTYNRDDCLATWVVARWLLDRDRDCDRTPEAGHRG
jgi:predicted RecB family nuclease